MDAIKSIFWNTSERRLRCGFRLVLHIVVTFIVMILTMLPVMGVIGGRFSDSLEMMIAGSLQQVVVLATVVLACFLLDRRFFRDLGMQMNKRWWLDLLGGLVLGGLMMTAIFVIEYSQGWITLGDGAQAVSDQSSIDLATVLPLQLGWLLTMVAVGFSEEIFSRGYHMKNLMEGFKRLGAISSFLLATLISSSFFGVLHAMNPNATLIATIGIFGAGVMFCVGRVMTGSLAAPIGMHITWNYFQGAVFGFPVSGQSMEGSLVKISSTEDSIWTGGDFGPEAGLMGLFAILLAIVVFIFWPKRELEASKVATVTDSNEETVAEISTQKSAHAESANPILVPGEDVSPSISAPSAPASDPEWIDNASGSWNLGLAELAQFRPRRGRIS